MKQASMPASAVFRFAPSPNGMLHLGHAYSALLNLDSARKLDAKILLRIEDIDTTRCTPALEDQMLTDLEWIGFEWDETPRRQSEHFDEYRIALDALAKRGLVYPAALSRMQIRHQIASANPAWPLDPDGVPLYPATERDAGYPRIKALLASGKDHALRLDMTKALLHCGQPIHWQESGYGPDSQTGKINADPARWGDVALGRKDAPASYHLACVLDDALQGVTNIIRGMDLFHATSVHRLMQSLLELPAPDYHHHGLIRSPDGRKLSKSRADTGLRFLREAGASQSDIRRMIGLYED